MPGKRLQPQVETGWERESCARPDDIAQVLCSKIELSLCQAMKKGLYAGVVPRFQDVAVDKPVREVACGSGFVFGVADENPDGIAADRGDLIQEITASHLFRTAPRNDEINRMLPEKRNGF